MIGEVFGDTFITVRNTRKHYYKLGQGYPISDEALKFLKENNIENIIIKEYGKTIRRFKSTVSSYLKGDLIQHEPFELQRIIPLRNLQIIQ